jgi:hypothetical protein
MHGLTCSELVELGAPKMEGQYLASRSMSYSIFFKHLFIAYDFFQQTTPVGECGNLNSSMLDYARSVGLC